MHPAGASRSSNQFNVLIIGGMAGLVILFLALTLSGNNGREEREARAVAGKQKADVDARLAEEKRKNEETQQKMRRTVSQKSAGWPMTSARPRKPSWKRRSERWPKTSARRKKRVKPLRLHGWRLNWSGKSPQKRPKWN